MTRLHIVIPALFLIALTSCIAAADSYTDQSPFGPSQPTSTNPTLSPFQLTRQAGEATQVALYGTNTPAPTNTPEPPTNTPEPTNTPVPPTDTPVPPTNTPVPPTNTPGPSPTPTSSPTPSSFSMTVGHTMGYDTVPQHNGLSWTAPTNVTVTGYRILRKRKGQINASAVDEQTFSVLVNDTGNTSTSYRDTSTPDCYTDGSTYSCTYTYQVKALNGTNVVANSTVACVTWFATSTPACTP